jgi:hypothetical protein
MCHASATSQNLEHELQETTFRQRQFTMSNEINKNSRRPGEFILSTTLIYVFEFL